MSNKKMGLISLKWILIHAGLAFAAVKTPIFSAVWEVVVLLIAIYTISKNKNRNEEAAKWAGYFAALEVILRISKHAIGYEVGKYAIIIFLLYGYFLNPHRPSNKKWISCILLLLPAIVLMESFNAEGREILLFTLSGIIALLVSAFYFDGRRITYYTFYSILSFVILPIFSMAIILTLKTPDFSSIVFTANSTDLTTGGFGPVHVSTILGCGILIVVLLMLTGKTLFYNRWGDYAVLALLGFRLMLSFSRSGLFAVGLAIVPALIVFNKVSNKSFKAAKPLIVTVVLAIGVWNLTSSVTGGMSENRFLGYDTEGNKKEDITTGRTDLFNEEIVMFEKSPIIGIGVGNVMRERALLFGDDRSSHTEYARLLAEHGLLGIVAIFYLFFLPYRAFYRRYGINKVFLVAFVSFTLFNMTSASTRTALPMFLYGLGFIILYDDERYTTITQ